jgi:hypothetical protein
MLDLGVKGKARLNLDINNIDKLDNSLKSVATKIAYAVVIGAFALALAIILAALLFSQQNILVTLFAIFVCICALVLIGGMLVALVAFAVNTYFKKHK